MAETSRMPFRKYNFRNMKVGDVWYVTGVKACHAQQAWYSTRKRHPELRDRQYLWWNVNGGVRIERVG